MTLESSQPPSILRFPQVQARTGLSRSALSTLVRNGRFPRPVRLTHRALGWLSADIDAWISARHAATVMTLPPTRTEDRS